MTLIYSVILCLLFKAHSCQRQCVQGLICCILNYSKYKLIHPALNTILEIVVILLSLAETPDDTEFSINVTTSIKAESGKCISIPYEISFPTNKVKVPYKKIWFKGDPENGVSVTVVDNNESQRKDYFRIEGLPRGEHEYGFLLEWECNQTYIFQKRVRISVSGE